jgi:molecular chaperone DnaJ
MKELKNINLYSRLEIDKNSSENEIKNSYRQLAKKYHPDVSSYIDAEIKFQEILVAYEILSDPDRKSDYDLKSRYGKNYNEYFELLDVSIDFSYDDGKEKLEAFKRNEILNIQIEVDDSFNGSIEYERWVKCKTCDGSGKDLSSKILIKDVKGNILKTFDADDGCDFCEGSGKDYKGGPCSFCSGKGRVGLNPCKTCSGEKRIRGKQKLSGIKLDGKETKVESMGHYSKDETGKTGYVLLTKK